MAKTNKFGKGMASKNEGVVPQKATGQKKQQTPVNKKSAGKKEIEPKAPEIKADNVDDVTKIEVKYPSEAILQPDVKKRTEKIFVKYEFTKDEIVEKSTMLSTRSNTIANLRSELDSIKSQYKSRIENENAAFQELLNEVGQKYKMIEKDCEVRMHDPEKNLKSYYDDGEFVKSDNMLPGDYQIAFNFQADSDKDSELKDQAF